MTRHLLNDIALSIAHQVVLEVLASAERHIAIDLTRVGRDDFGMIGQGDIDSETSLATGSGANDGDHFGYRV